MLVGINLLLSVCRLGGTIYPVGYIVQSGPVGRLELDPVARQEFGSLFFHGGDEPLNLTGVVLHGFLDRCNKKLIGC